MKQRETHSSPPIFFLRFQQPKQQQSAPAVFSPASHRPRSTTGRRHNLPAFLQKNRKHPRIECLVVGEHFQAPMASHALDVDLSQAAAECLDAHNSGGNKCLSVPEASWHWAHNNKQMHPSRPNDRNQRRSSALGGLDFEEPAQLLAIGASHRFLRWCGNGTAAPIQTGTSDDAHETLSSEESAHLLQHRHSWWWLQHLLGSSLVPASRSTYIPAAGPLWMPGGNCPHGRAEGIAVRLQRCSVDTFSKI